MRVGEALRRRALARVQWYRLTPARLYFIDNQQGLGHRDEVEIGD